MKAKDMFEKLGYYEVNKAFHKASYRKIYTLCDNFDDLKEEIKLDNHLRFACIDFEDTLGKTINIYYEDCETQITDDGLSSKIWGMPVGVPMGTCLSLEELQAINKQVEELGWKNETDNN